MKNCGSTSVTPAGRSNVRRSQMSAVLHGVRITLPGGLRAPKPAGPSVQLLSSKLVADHPSAGVVVVNRHVAGVSRDVSRIVFITGGGVKSDRFAARTRATSGLMIARSYVIRPFTS